MIISNNVYHISFEKYVLNSAFKCLFLFCMCNSFDRRFCETLAMELFQEFQDREDAIRAGTRKRDEKKLLQAEKKVKKTRNETEKEKGKRYLNYNYFRCFNLY